MRIMLLSYRVSGTDGVSLEAENWKKILTRMGHRVTFVAGKLDRAGIVIPELYFQWPKVVDIHDRVVYGNERYQKIESEIFELAGVIEGKLRRVLNGGKVDLLIAPNILSLPMHFPFAVALTRIIDEFQIPTLARHHDFWWERDRFLKSHMFPFFKRWFPPKLPQIHHVVINSLAKEELKKRTDIDADIIWDSYDFGHTIDKKDAYARKWRADFDIAEDDIVFLQATRIVPRKRIELAIDFVKKLNNPKAILIIAGYVGDEGKDYHTFLHKYAHKAGIRHRFIGNQVNTKRRIIKTGREGEERERVYTLWDCYVNSNFVTYPTEIEGFGNQFVEAVYFKKPVLLTPYPVFNADIAPLGFEYIDISNNSDDAVRKVDELMANPQKYAKLVDGNFALGKKYFSYEWAEKRIEKVFEKMGLEQSG